MYHHAVQGAVLPADLTTDVSGVLYDPLTGAVSNQLYYQEGSAGILVYAPRTTDVEAQFDTGADIDAV